MYRTTAIGVNPDSGIRKTIISPLTECPGSVFTVGFTFGLLALGTSCTSMPKEWPTPCGKNALLTPLARIASSAFQEPLPIESGDLKIPRRWKPLTSVRWQRYWTASQCRPGFKFSNESWRRCQLGKSADNSSSIQPFALKEQARISL